MTRIDDDMALAELLLKLDELERELDRRGFKYDTVATANVPPIKPLDYSQDEC